MKAYRAIWTDGKGGDQIRVSICAAFASLRFSYKDMKFVLTLLIVLAAQMAGAKEAGEDKKPAREIAKQLKVLLQVPNHSITQIEADILTAYVAMLADPKLDKANDPTEEQRRWYLSAFARWKDDKGDLLPEERQTGDNLIQLATELDEIERQLRNPATKDKKALRGKRAKKQRELAGLMADFRVAYQRYSNEKDIRDSTWIIGKLLHNYPREGQRGQP